MARRDEQWTILLVDADPAPANMLTGHLTEEQFEVVHVHDSSVALAVLETGRRIDLLLAGIAMPEGTPNGVSLALMALVIVPDIKFVFMTDHPDLLGTGGALPGHAFVRRSDLATLTHETRRLLAE